MTARIRPGAPPVEDAVRRLRATRAYGPEPIADAVIDRWIDAARWCGSSKNRQPWRFIVIRDREALATLSTLGEHAWHLADSAAAIAVAVRRDQDPLSVAVDLGRVAQTLMLLAHEDGVGSCIAILEPADHVQTARDLLGVPGSLDLDLIIAFGEPRPLAPLPPDQAVSAPGRLPRDALRRWDRWDSPA